MRIQDAVKKTGLQKRTIYYYIDEQLINPDINENNGYRDFSEDDIRKLILIHKLRDAGLPISDIRAILSHPRTTPFYLNKQLKKLQTQLTIMEQTMKNLDEFTGHLPVCKSLNDLYEQFSDIEFKPDISKYQITFESRDARLIAQYLWRAFIDVPMTEYRQFLWEKVMKYTLEHIKTDLKITSQYLQTLPPEQVDAVGVNQYLRNQKIIELTKADYPNFVEELKSSLLLFAQDNTQKEQWTLLYEPIIRPTTLFAFSASRWLFEFHPDYQKYYENIHVCCMMLKDYIDSDEGENFKKILEEAFNGSCDFEASSYGELEIAASFHHSVYSLMNPREIKKFLMLSQSAPSSH